MKNQRNRRTIFPLALIFRCDKAHPWRHWFFTHKCFLVWVHVIVLFIIHSETFWNGWYECFLGCFDDTNCLSVDLLDYSSHDGSLHHNWVLNSRFYEGWSTEGKATSWSGMTRVTRPEPILKRSVAEKAINGLFKCQGDHNILKKMICNEYFFKGILFHSKISVNYRFLNNFFPEFINFSPNYCNYSTTGLFFFRFL